LARICKTYKEKYPLVQIALHIATADMVYEMMKKGLVDRIEFNISIRHNKIMSIKWGCRISKYFCWAAALLSATV